MKKIIRKSLETILKHKIEPSRVYAKNILSGLKKIYSKYGLYEDRHSNIKIKFKCALCNKKHMYSITGCNIPQSIHVLGNSKIEPNFICRDHNTISNIKDFYKSIVSNYQKNRVIPYGYYIVKKPVKEIFCKKLMDMENFLYNNDLEDNSILKVFYTKSDIISIFSNKIVINYPKFEYTTSRETKQYEYRQYNVDFADFKPEFKIFDYEDYSEYDCGDADYDTDYNYNESEKQTDMNIKWSNEYIDLEQYLSRSFLKSIENLRKNQKLEI